MAGTAPPQIPGCRDLSLIGERVARSLYAATSDKLGRAVTVIAYPPLAEGRTWDDFDRAAATAQRLGVHPSMISIHEWGHAGDGRPWIVTDPQPAEALDTVLKLDGPLEPERALQVGVLLAGALETAHGAGIVHGDLSPARLVLGSHGEPLMTETGLAPFAVFPGLGALNNPVRYHAPPEVLERTETTTATDVYSLASTVYALIAGRAPHEKPAEVTDSNASLLLRVLQLPVPAIERPGLPPWLLDALRTPLAPDPGKRPQQAIEVAWILQDVQRRAGFAVTEPVVLDLDDIENQRSRRATGGAMASSRTARGSWPAPLSAAGAWPDTPDVAAPVPDPHPAPLRQAATYSFPDTAPAPNGRSDHAEDPAPTIFPFAVPDAPEALSGNGTSHWPPAPAGAAAPTNGATLWPSSWPSADQPDELPAWAQPPPADEPEAESALWSPPTGAEPEPLPGATTDLTAPPDLPPWAGPAPAPDSPPWSATEPPAAPGEPATLPPWATPAPPADTDSASGMASSALPPWATPEPPADPTARGESAALPPRATPAPPADTDNAHSPAPSALPPWATPEPPADTSPSAPTAPGKPVGLPPWASPASADTPPWLATPEPAPAPTADLPPWAATPADTPPWAAAAEPAPPTDIPPWAATPAPAPTADSPPWTTPGPAESPADTPPWAAAPEPAPIAASPPWTTPASAPTAGTPEPGPAADGSTGEAPDAPAADQSPWAAAPGAGSAGPPAGLPAWWSSSGPGSAASDADAGASDPPGGGEPSAAPLPPANGNGSSTSYGVPRPPELDVLPAWYTDPLPLGSGNERLPGGGDELRTLFGAVVGDPPPAPPSPAPPPPAAPAAREAPADVDPLGPPTARPPLDLSRLQDPFGPAAPPTPIAIGTGTGAPVRTHPPAPPADETPPGGRVVTGRPPSPAAAAAAAAARSARDGDTGATDAAPGAPVAAGPPALPVLILVGVVAVLILGVAWLVITGDDAAQPASERPEVPAVEAPTGLAVTPVPEGAQLTWQGAADGTYVVTVLSTTEAPRELPPAVGTTALVPIAGAPAGTERCFTVAVAPAANDGEPGTSSDPACTGSATPDQMLPAPGG